MQLMKTWCPSNDILQWCIIVTAKPASLELHPLATVRVVQAVQAVTMQCLSRTIDFLRLLLRKPQINAEHPKFTRDKQARL
jgi:hypothetical protein